MNTPFPLEPHTLPIGLLRPIQDSETSFLAAACAAIDPWRRLGVRPTALIAYFEGSDPALHRFTIVQGEQPVGVVALRWPWLRGPFIEALAVLPELHGKGIGKAVVEWTAARAGGVSSHLWASVSDFNVGGRLFWRRLGFAEVLPLPGFFHDGATELLIHRKLSA